MKTKAKVIVGVFLVSMALMVLYRTVLYDRQNSTLPPKKPFKVLLATWVGFSPFYIAEEKGYFKEEGLEVELSVSDNQATRRAAFSSGKIHAMIDTLDSLANGIPAGLDAKCILKIDDSYGGDGLVVNKNIDSFKDLKGKTVAYQYGLPPQFFFLYLLKQNGMSSKDVKSLDMEASEAGAAFIAKKVDAAVTWEPWLSQAGNTPHGKIFVTSKEAPGLITDILVVNPDVLKDRKKDVQKLLRAWFKSLNFIASNPNEAASIMGKHLGLPAEEVQGMLMGLKFSSYEDNRVYFGLNGSFNKFDKLFKEAVEVWIDEGSVPTSLKNKSFNPSNPEILRGLYNYKD